MTKKYSTKRALIASILALCMCFTMLIGTTFAWFTDSVTSSGNVIQTGSLKVGMYWAEGDEDPDAFKDWKDAKSGAIFNNTFWEPGYVEAKHIKIVNEGTLSLKYQMRILATDVVSELADVIDVYYFYDVDENAEKDLTGAVQLDRMKFTDANRLGTLSEVLKNNLTVNDEIIPNANSISNVIKGSLEKDEFTTLTIALKMRESAGNEYQNLSIGSEFSIQILATQYTSENDSFDNQYDGGADFAPQEKPSAMVSVLNKEEMSNIIIEGNEDIALDTAYQFEPTETADQAAASKYGWWHADFHVSADADVPANSMLLAGYFELYGDLKSGGKWIGLSSDATIKAGDPVRLIQDGVSAALGGYISVDYNSICTIGNDGIGFLCGAKDLTGANEGTTITVELRLYETACDDPGCNHNKKECETGNYISIGTIKYTFDNPNVVYLDDGSRVRYGENGEVTLEGVDKVNVTDGTYYVPYGVTSLKGQVFAQNTDIKEVVLPETVRTLSNAFEYSVVEKAVLNEGLEQIDSRAFIRTPELREVVIPSTVTVIEDNAFQKTGLKTITIPATVETIGENAFGASMLETVIIEGDTSIQGYAFRGCTELRTVYLNGDNTFIPSTLNGRSSAWFCNGESNQLGRSNITFYVQNEAVAERLKVAMDAEYTTDPAKVDKMTIKIIVPTKQTISTEDGSQSLDVVISEQAANSIVYHSAMNPYAADSIKNKIGAITVYTKADLVAAWELNQAGIYVPNGGNDISPELNFGADIDFAGGSFYGFGHEFTINGNGHTLSNINFIAPDGFFGKAGLLYKGGNSIVNDLTIKNATSTGAQAGIFGGNIDNVQLNNCALEGDITVNWKLYSDASYTEDYNGIGAVWGVISTERGIQIIDCDTTNASITLNKGGIYYPAGYNPEGNNLVGAVYGGTYNIVVDGVAHKAVTVANTNDFQNALNNATDNDYIFLISGVTYDAVEIKAPMAKNVTVFGTEGAIVKGIACNLPSFTTGAELYGFTLQNVDFESKGFYLTNVKNTSPWGFVENFTMDGCSFKGDNMNDVLGNRLFDYGTDSPGSHQFINLKITNCTVDTAIQGIRVGALRGECEISGNVITNVAHNAITIRTAQAGTVLVEGNKISNGGDRAFRIGVNSATVNYVNNTITNTGDAEDGSNFKANTLGTVTFSGNTVDGEAWNPLA